jgi:hypothetical protein
LKRIGVTTVLKLNKYSSRVEEDEERAAAGSHGLGYNPVLMQPEDFPYNWNPWAAPTPKQVLEALSVLEDQKNGKVFIHCSKGKDRTGLLVALYRAPPPCNSNGPDLHEKRAVRAVFEEVYGPTQRSASGLDQQRIFKKRRTAGNCTRRHQASCLQHAASIHRLVHIPPPGL